MDKLNNYIPVPIKIPEPVKAPCLTPACKEINRLYEEGIRKRQLDLQVLGNNSPQQPTK